jgi:hypothetical protein
LGGGGYLHKFALFGLRLFEFLFLLINPAMRAILSNNWRSCVDTELPLVLCSIEYDTANIHAKDERLERTKKRTKKKNAR